MKNYVIFSSVFFLRNSTLCGVWLFCFCCGSSSEFCNAKTNPTHKAGANFIFKSPHSRQLEIASSPRNFGRPSLGTAAAHAFATPNTMRIGIYPKTRG